MVAGSEADTHEGLRGLPRVRGGPRQHQEGRALLGPGHGGRAPPAQESRLPVPARQGAGEDRPGPECVHQRARVDRGPRLRLRAQQPPVRGHVRRGARPRVRRAGRGLERRAPARLPRGGAPHPARAERRAAAGGAAPAGRRDRGLLRGARARPRRGPRGQGGLRPEGLALRAPRAAGGGRPQRGAGPAAGLRGRADTPRRQGRRGLAGVAERRRQQVRPRGARALQRSLGGPRRTPHGPCLQRRRHGCRGFRV
mmetsp:Transcript_100700/g.324959  ORF Transcript_100700/g.324959 Transcript_100700/m.324959 type:complete len:254 (-) Transcript_100700:268-1029(-)